MGEQAGSGERGLFAATLTVEQVEQEAAAIVTLAGPGCDYEALHGMEDDLRAVVLEAIAIGRFTPVDMQRVALYALRTRDADFPRYAA